MSTLTGNSPRREQRLQSLMLDRLVARYNRRIAREIRRVMNNAADMVASGASFTYALQDHERELKAVMLSMYRATAEVFSEHIAKNKAARMLEQMKQFAIPTTPIVDAIIAEWVAMFGGEHITLITETTRDEINEIVQQGVRDGLDEKQIAKLINEVAPTKSASRAQTIARTETHAAANATMQETAKAMKLDMLKTWVPAGSRTRDAHRRAGDDYGAGNGIAIDDAFIVDGEALRFPGDPAGSPENVINCRCAVVYEVL